MFKTFYPNVWMDSTYEIDFAKYYRQGYRLVLFDIDNTLVCHGAPQNEQSLPFLQGLLDMGFKLRFLSNNKEYRVSEFVKPLKGDAGYIFKAGKPSTRSYLKAMQDTGECIETTLFVGDQLFTDVWGANRSGIFSILVKPIDKHEEIQIILKRRLEAIVLCSYKHMLKKREKYGLIGDPVEHSRSPLIHNSWAAMRRDKLTYSLFHVKKEDLGKQVDFFKKNRFGGFNITVPHKTDIIPYLDFVSPEAMKIGAVNTVKITKQGLFGINTDFTGLRRDFKDEGIEIKDKDSLIIGAGGAAKAVAAMLITEGAKNVFVLNRTYEKAVAFCEDMNERFETKVCKPVEADKWCSLPDSLFCVQTTSRELEGKSAFITETGFYEKLSHGYDIVPLKKTDFRKRCEELSVPNYDGYGMLVNQAADAYEFWLECELSKTEVKRVRRMLSDE